MINDKRVEFKTICTTKEIDSIFYWLKDTLDQIYSKRTITSLYFDTLDFSLFKEKELYDVDTKTVRFREYSNDRNIYKEIKTNKFDGKYKTSVLTNFLSLDKINYCTEMGRVLYPSLFTKYTRQYFVSDNFRMTIDSDITFTTHRFRSLNKIEKKLNMKVLEFKFLDNFKNPDILNRIPLPTQGFSKFKQANNDLYGKY